MRFVRPKPLTQAPRVSVVIPCYNYGHFLPLAVDSVLSQTGLDVDVLIVDDASPDGSGDVAREIAAREPRVAVLQHETNKGHLTTYNDGLSAVTGKYVVLLSADDLLAPGSLARSVALLEAFPSVGMTYGFTRAFETEPVVWSTKLRSWSIWSGDAWIERICRNGGNTVINPEVVMRRDLLDDLNGYDMDLPMTADMDLWLRAAQRADVGRINGPDIAYYRVHGANMHLNRFAGIITDLRARADTAARLFGEGRSARDDELHRIVRRAIAREAIDLAAAAYDQGIADEVPVEEFAALARELCPSIVSSWRWRLLSRRMTTTAPRAWMRTFDAGRTLRLKIYWRRWARYGF
jgi:glycosyltransferase involved in cell wall biosynthesis